MGNTFEVYVWEDGIYWQTWSGEDKSEAFAELEKAVQEGQKCVRLDWRPL